MVCFQKKEKEQGQKPQEQLAQAVRLSTLDFDSLSGDDLITLCAQDFSQINTGIRHEEKRKQRIGFSNVV